MTTIRNLDSLQRKLKTLENFQRKLKKPTEESLALLQDYVAKAPRKKKGAFSAMATPGQRRAYWYLVGKGLIEHSDTTGYKRTSTIVRKWTSKVSMTSNGVKGVLGNNAPGAIWVQAAKTQQPFHKASGWRTEEEAIEKNADKIQAKYDKVVKRELNR